MGRPRRARGPAKTATEKWRPTVFALALARREGADVWPGRGGGRGHIRYPARRRRPAGAVAAPAAAPLSQRLDLVRHLYRKADLAERAGRILPAPGGQFLGSQAGNLNTRAPAALDSVHILGAQAEVFS